MKYYRYIVVAAAAMMCLNMFAVRQAPNRRPNLESKPAASQDDDRAVIDIRGRRMFPIEIDDTTAISLVGGVIAYHNGAVITCDSAVRYSDRRIECFGNVIINQDSTYVYGDRADYDGDRNLAHVYSPLIKMVDGDATLYTYNFSFNTLDNIGEYYGGGTILRGETLLESKRGLYFSKSKDFICAGDVELRDSTYRIQSDSMGYNMDTEIASFYTKTYIWNDKGEILSANKGWYYTTSDHYHFVSDAYILTADQEVWADDMNYWSDVEDAVLRLNVQIRDEDQKILAFGDYGVYFGESGNAMLTENPSLISFYEESDSLYMRADTMFMYVLDSTSVYSPDYVGDKVARASSDSSEMEEELIDPVADALRLRQQEMADMIRDSEEQTLGSSTEGVDVVAEDDTASEGDSAEALEGQEDEQFVDDEIANAEDATLQEPDDVVEPTPILTKEVLKAQRKAEKQRLKEEKRLAKQRARAEKRGEIDPEADTETADDAKDESGEQAPEGDGEQLPADGEEEIIEPEEEKKKERVIVAYYDVKVWREDFQVICDSLLAFSIDTTAHLHLDPVLWSGENQITSDLAVIYMVDEALDRAVFTGGNPIMSSKVDNWHYNQVTGKVIEAFFEDNDIYRTDANGNGQTYYYMQDEKTGEFQGFIAAECADITFHISDRELDSIVWRGNPEYVIYPMDKIPDTQDQVLPNFKWVGDKRPSKEEIFSRTIHPSQREEYVAMPTPNFPLTDKINKRKQSLIRSGSWQDRSDDISAEAHDFIKEIESRPAK